MGYLKDKMMQYEDRGLKKPPDKNVCSKHLNDDIINDYIFNNGSIDFCSYCESTKKTKVLSLDVLSQFIGQGIYAFYEDAANWLPYESAEGGYQGEHYDTWDLIRDEIGLDADNYDIIKDLIDSFPEGVWCRNDPFELSQDKLLMSIWQRFCSLVKHQIRYSLFKTKEFDNGSHDKITDVLIEISKVIEQLNLLKLMKEDSRIYRARQHRPSEIINTINDIASPPTENATLSNRMSPSGISMFYGAFDQDTALKETYDESFGKEKPYLSIGTFICKKKFRIIDLSDLPCIPSIFDETNRKLFYMTSFLHSFTKDISKEIARDGREHIEYVPTQIITEYFRYVFPKNKKTSIDGIIYKSSKTKSGKCCVLFLNNEECIKKLRLDKIELRKDLC